MTRPPSRSAHAANPPAEPGILARMALAMTDWTERWMPDAFIFALIATVIVVVAGVAFTPSSLPQVIDAWGKGFWEL
ncbi:MAG: TIGR00366 family protein [Chthoniobacterales bacterium]|nr:TIGR00366 family protein [Chthoniobacterales bacterium]